MLDFPRWKISFIIAICLWGVWLAVPNILSEQTRENFPSLLPRNSMNLGLDLRGGSYLLLEVDFKAYLKEQLQDLVDETRAKLRKERIGYRALAAVNSGATFQLRNADEKGRVEEIFQDMYQDAQLEISESGNVSIQYRDDYIENLKVSVVEQSIEIVRRRVDETGTREPIIQRQGDTRILLQVPGLENPERLKELLGRTAKMTFHLMDEANPYPAREVTPPRGTMLLHGNRENPDDYQGYFLIKRQVMLSGDLLVDARPSFQNGQPVVSFRFNNQGGRKFAQVTRENVGKPFAIVLDGIVLTAPNINEPIPGGQGIISGNFTTQQTQDLSLLLRAGALPAPLKILEERTVGPSLGKDSIEAGKMAALAGVVLVVVLMLLFYGLFGVFSNIALAFNLVFVVGFLSLFQATLTLPGIAGMVLTMGMAVDANVLIFERIKEETRHGKTPFAAIDNGFSMAFKTIFDSNITTIMATLLLYIYGSGPVKGFAVTLSIGIICSMFSAILLTRMFIVLWLKRTKPKTLPI